MEPYYNFQVGTCLKMIQMKNVFCRLNDEKGLPCIDQNMDLVSTL